MLPGERLLDAAPARLAHPHTSIRILEQYVDAGRELRLVVRPRVDGRIAGSHAGLAQVEGCHRARHGHVFGDLHERREVVQRARGVRCDPDIRRSEDARDLRLRDETPKLDRSAEPELAREPLGLRPRVAVAEEDRVPIAASRAQRRERSNRVIDAVLGPHHPHVGEQVGLPAPQLRIGWFRREHREVRTIAHDEHVVRVLPAALDGDLPVGLVGREHDVGEPERQPLERQEGLDDHVLATAVPRSEELREEVVVVEDEARALPPQRQRGQKEQIGRIARVNDIEWALASELARKSADPPERDRVLAGIPHGTPSGPSQGESVDLDAVAQLEWIPVAGLPLRARDDNLVACAGEGRRLLPDTPVEWDRQVLDENEHTRSHEIEASHAHPRFRPSVG